ncbi:MAG: nucleoside deaminase [Bacteroidales bacterium]|jgi:tRNA(adenine34) deaminase|nr:nucleoside deaminase [Bacteroidales bacterium]
MTEQYYMAEAIKQAKIAFERDEVPVGAVVVCNGKIIARAYNQTENLNDVTAHAEIQAITMAADALGGKYLNKCELYVTLEPCPMCAAALHWAQLGKLVYAAQDSKRGFSLFQPSLLHPKTEVVSGIAAEEATAMLRNFFAKKR